MRYEGKKREKTGQRGGGLSGNEIRRTDIISYVGFVSPLKPLLLSFPNFSNSSPAKIVELRIKPIICGML